MLADSGTRVPTITGRHTRARGNFPIDSRVILPAPGHVYEAEQAAAGHPAYLELAPWPHVLIEWGSARVIAQWTPTGHTHQLRYGAEQ